MEKLTYVERSPQKSSATVTKIIRDKKNIHYGVSVTASSSRMYINIFGCKNVQSLHLFICTS